MAHYRPLKANDYLASAASMKSTLKRMLAEADLSRLHSDKSKTLPPALLLDKLKSVHITVDETTQRHVATMLAVDYPSFVDSLEFDSKLQRWKLPDLATPLIQLSRNTQISGSNTCLRDGSTPVPLQTSDSKEVLDHQTEQMKALCGARRVKTALEANVDIQHAMLLKSMCSKAAPGPIRLPVSAFEAICKKFRNNPLCALDLVPVLADDSGTITEESLDALITAFKYAKAPDKFLRGEDYADRQHPESQQQAMLPVPQMTKPMQELSFRIAQKYRNLPLAFSRFDRDGDGRIGERDFVESALELNLDVSESDILDLFALLDEDHQHFLSFSQFSRLKGDPRFPEVTRTQARYSQKDTQSKSPSRPSVRIPTSSVSPSRLYFGPRRPTKAELPSDKDPEHAYGSRTLFTEDVKDLISNVYEREFLEKLRRREEQLSLRKEKRHGATLTNAVILRNEAIKSRLAVNKPRQEWKLPRFALKPLPKVAGEQLLSA